MKLRGFPKASREDPLPLPPLSGGAAGRTAEDCLVRARRLSQKTASRFGRKCIGAASTCVETALVFAEPHFWAANRIHFAEKCAKHGPSPAPARQSAMSQNLPDPTS